MELNALLAAVALLIVTLLHRPGGASAEVFKDCGGFLREPHGVVHSPGFPDRFPVPLACRWIIHAPPGKKIVLYFTQYFLREAFYVTEYEQYTDELTYSGRKSLGQINFHDHIRTLVAYKPFLALDFALHHMTNIHLRVQEYLENVYGFNITYEVVDRGDRVRQDTCSVNDCSFLGHCIASADFSAYRCDCFPQFFGHECQYGPFCDPDKGINMCLNQGRCRYFYGSMVNICECPPGYVGPKCEQAEDSLDEEHSAGLSSSGKRNPECAKLGCSDRCEKDYEGHLYCACQDGFKLDTDNLTCVEQELYRVSVTVPLVARPAVWNKELATTQALTILLLSGLRTAKRFHFDGVNSSGGEDVQMFHFYVDRSDLEVVPSGVKNLIRRDNLFNLTILAANCTVDIDPEMKLLSVENYDNKPALEGKSLTLVCTARGSRRLKFRWYKDQFLFNASLTSRNAWEVRIQDDYDDKQMSIFNVDGVTMFDKGQFSCEIEDFGEVENKSVTVELMPLPQVEIKPLTASLLKGQSVSLRCLSPDENMRTFFYQWLRNGVVLTPKDRVNGEIVEDLLPSGSRLYIRRLEVSANYTCRVVNKAGPAEKSAFVFLISPNMSDMVCESDAHEGVKWNRTYGGYFDLQKCPIDTADFKVVGLEEGYARRDCVCDVTCSWGPPNYARCHSVHLIYLYEQLERRQLGYQQGGLSHIYDSLYRILRKAQNRTLAGDVDMFAINLHTLFDVTLKFPAVAPNPSKSSFNLTTVASFMNILLDEVKTTNDYEKRDLSVGARFLRVCEILAELTRENPSIIPLFNVTLKRIGFVVKNVTIRSHNAANGNADVPEVGGAAQASMAYTGRQLMSLPEDVPKQKDENKVKIERKVEVLQVTFSPDIFPILRVSTPRSDREQFLTPLVSMLPIGDNHHLLNDSVDAEDRQVELEFVHPLQFPVFFENVTKCVAWDRRDSWQLVGEWKSSLCDVIHTTANVTRCLCPLPGHYAVVVIATNTTLPPMLQAQRDNVLLVGSILSMCGLVAALLVYFISWRHISNDSSMIHVNFILSLAGINLVCILCLRHTETELLCTAGKVVLHFLQLAAFSFLLIEAIHTYVRIQSSIFGLNRIKYTSLKYFVIGWGIPSIATIAVLLLSEVFGYDDSCTRWCWWSVGEWQHYSFLVPLVVMVLVQVLIMSACLLCTRLWTDEHRFHDRKKYIYIAARSFVLQTLVVLLSVSGHYAEASRFPSHQWFFFFIDVLLTITVIITLVILKPHVRRVVFSFLLPAHKRGLAFSSFRAFMLPDRVEDSEEQVVKQMQQYCRELDRSKFTSQHKQALRNLLGSSSSGSDASASGTGSPPARTLSVPASGLPLARRTQSADSRSSGSDCGGGGGCRGGGVGVGGDSRPVAGGGGGGGGEGGGGGARASERRRVAGTKKTRVRRNPRGHPGAQTREGGRPPDLPAQCQCWDSREGGEASPHQQRLRPRAADHPAQRPVQQRRTPRLGPGHEGRGDPPPTTTTTTTTTTSTVPDSGYEGAESDSLSLRKGPGAAFDLDSQLSSDLDTEMMLRDGDSPPSSSSSSSDPVRAPPPPPSPPPHRLHSLPASPVRTPASSSRGHDDGPAGASAGKGGPDVVAADVVSDCDVICLPAAAVVRQQTVAGEDEAAATEREALLSVDTAEDKVCEHDTFL